MYYFFSAYDFSVGFCIEPNFVCSFFSFHCSCWSFSVWFLFSSVGKCLNWAQGNDLHKNFANFIHIHNAHKLSKPKIFDMIYITFNVTKLKLYLSTIGLKANFFFSFLFKWWFWNKTVKQFEIDENRYGNVIIFRNVKIHEKQKKNWKLWLKSSQHLMCFRSREKKSRGLQNISSGKGFFSTVNIITFSSLNKIFALSAIALLSDNRDNIFVQEKKKNLFTRPTH